MMEPPLQETLAVAGASIVAALPVAGDELVSVARPGIGVDLLDARRLARRCVLRSFWMAGLEGDVAVGWSAREQKAPCHVSVRRLEGNPAAATIAVDELILGSDVVEVGAWDSKSGKQMWEWVPDPRLVETGSGNSVRTNLCSDGERVYFGMRDGTIRALRVTDGEEVWRTVLVQSPTPDEDREFQRWASEPTGSGSVRDGVLYFHASDRAVALDATSGRHIWEAKAYCTVAQLHLDSYHCLGVGGEYEILDARTGRRTFKKDLKSVTPSSFHNGGLPTYRPMIVSDTHMFCGYGIGYLLAFERTTGKLVWHTRAKPALSFHQENYFQIVNGRLYTGDYGTMRIYEEVNPTDPVLIQQRADIEAQKKTGKARPSSRAATETAPRRAAKRPVSKKQAGKAKPTPARGRKA
jgi:hypothetical protein